FIPPLVIDRTDPKVLYFGTYRLYRTNDQADLWTPISPDLSRTGSGSISTIAPAESNPAIVYVGTNDGHVQLTTDAGANWSIRSTGLPNRVITDIAVSAVDASIAIATLSGFGTGHVFRTTDSGVSWQNISGDLPDVPVNAVLHESSPRPAIYIGTDLGMFRSLDTGRTWVPFNDGFPNVAVFDLAYSRATGMIVAATHGRGMFGLTPIIAASVTLSQETLSFSAIGDTARILAAATDVDGDPITELLPSWRTLDARVATVNVSGVVRAAGNGTTSIVATIAGKADTAQVTVRQIVVAVAGLPDSASLVVGETRKFDAAAIDKNGIAVSDAPVTWSSTDAVAVAVDATGLVRAGKIGASTVSANSGTIRDTVALRIGAPSIVVLDASATTLSAAPSSANGSRIPLLRLQFRVDGAEPIRVTQLGFEVRGNDAGARLQLIHDRNGDGAISAGDPEIASAPAALRPGEPLPVVLPLGSLEVQVGQTISVLAALRMSGAAPNGTTFTATFAPTDTRSVGTRSNTENLINQPSAPVASAAVRSTVLAAGQRFSMSENPVRSGAVTFNFPVRPTLAGIYTLNGRLVADLTTRVSSDASVRWDLTNENGSTVSPGVYLLVFRIEGEQFRERLIVMRRAGDEEIPSTPSLTKR
ncbi:MAG: Ig-like domain-containing protein, partial [Longimicrobiales bacterium]